MKNLKMNFTSHLKVNYDQNVFKYVLPNSLKVTNKFIFHIFSLSFVIKVIIMTFQYSSMRCFSF